MCTLTPFEVAGLKLGIGPRMGTVGLGQRTCLFGGGSGNSNSEGGTRRADMFAEGNNRKSAETSNLVFSFGGIARMGLEIERSGIGDSILNGAALVRIKTRMVAELSKDLLVFIVAFVFGCGLERQTWDSVDKCREFN